MKIIELLDENNDTWRLIHVNAVCRNGKDVYRWRNENTGNQLQMLCSDGWRDDYSLHSERAEACKSALRLLVGSFPPRER